MHKLPRERRDVERLARAWIASPTSDNKGSCAPPLILRLIGVTRGDVHHNFARDQIGKAIKALWLDDQEAASIHINLALQPFDYPPSGATWDELADAAWKLERRRPNRI